MPTHYNVLKAAGTRALSLLLGVCLVLETAALAEPVSLDRPQTALGIKIPSDFATLREAHKGGGKLIIHFQDAHANSEGQLNLSKSMDFILKQLGQEKTTVFVEGSASDVTLDPLKQTIPQNQIKPFAKRLLLDGVISGEEHLNLTTSHNLVLQGIEEESLYAQSLEVYSRLLQKRPAILDHLQKIKTSLSKLKPRLYPKELLEWERKGPSFTALLRLARKSKIDLKNYPQILNLGKRRNPALINYEILNQEFEALKNQIYLSKLKSHPARLVCVLDAYSKLLAEGYSLKITPQDFQKLLVNKPALPTLLWTQFLNSKLTELGYFEDLISYDPLLDDSFRDLEDFYDLVNQRDEVFAGHMPKKMDRRSAILITGGYHTPNLTRLLKRQGYSYLVLTPKITKATSAKKYEKLLLSKGTLRQAGLLTHRGAQRLENTYPHTLPILDVNTAKNFQGLLKAQVQQKGIGARLSAAVLEKQLQAETIIDPIKIQALIREYSRLLEQMPPVVEYYRDVIPKLGRIFRPKDTTTYKALRQAIGDRAWFETLNKIPDFPEIQTQFQAIAQTILDENLLTRGGSSARLHSARAYAALKDFLTPGPLNKTIQSQLRGFLTQGSSVDRLLSAQAFATLKDFLSPHLLDQTIQSQLRGFLTQGDSWHRFFSAQAFSALKDFLTPDLLDQTIQSQLREFLTQGTSEDCLLSAQAYATLKDFLTPSLLDQTIQSQLRGFLTQGTSEDRLHSARAFAPLKDFLSPGLLDQTIQSQLRGFLTQGTSEDRLHSAQALSLALSTEITFRVLIDHPGNKNILSLFEPRKKTGARLSEEKTLLDFFGLEKDFLSKNFAAGDFSGIWDKGYFSFYFSSLGNLEKYLSPGEDAQAVAHVLSLKSLLRHKTIPQKILYLKALKQITGLFRKRNHLFVFQDLNSYRRLLSQNKIHLVSDTLTQDIPVRSIQDFSQQAIPEQPVTFIRLTKTQNLLDIASILFLNSLLSRIDIEKLDPQDPAFLVLEQTLQYLTQNKDFRLTKDHLNALLAYDPAKKALYDELAIPGKKTQNLEQTLREYLWAVKIVGGMA
jgi:hypothetical protein